MLKVRVSFDEKSEAKEAKQLVKKIEKFLSKTYRIRTSSIYWNTRKNIGGGRIYMNLEKKTIKKR